jgi:hypothetical protein
MVVFDGSTTRRAASMSDERGTRPGAERNTTSSLEVSTAIPSAKLSGTNETPLNLNETPGLFNID